LTEAVSTLLVDVQRGLERLYGLEAGQPVTEYLIPEPVAAGLPGDGRSRTLVSQEADCLSLGVVLTDSVHRELVRLDPRHRLDGDNINPFCALTEEVSHFVYLRSVRPPSARSPSSSWSCRARSTST
jgi:hypothetical protein